MSPSETDAPQAEHAAEGILAAEEVARHPLPGMAIPDQVAFSPDDRLITYLRSPERSLVRQLFVFDPATREEKLFVSPPDGGAPPAPK